MAGITFEAIQGPQLHRGGVSCGARSTGNMRSISLLLMQSTGFGSLPGFPCIYRVACRCCGPLQDANARLHWKRQGLLSGHMRRFVLRSLAAQRLDSLCGSFEIWDLGSMVVDRLLRRPPPASRTLAHTSTSRLRAPGVNVVDRSSSKRRGSGSKYDNCRPRMLPSPGRVARSSWLLTSERLCERG